jgi:hypothetical protein
VPFYAGSDTPGNLIADTTTYSASLDCEIIDADSLLRAGNITIHPSSLGDETDFRFIDRGCSVTSADAWIRLVPVMIAGVPLYSQTRFATCPPEAERGRLFILV